MDQVLIWMEIFVCMFWTLRKGNCESAIGTIDKDCIFYHAGISGTPSTLATIEYSITFTSAFYATTGQSFVVMDIYTTDDDVNLKTECANDAHGQVWNEDLHTKLRPGSYRATKCNVNRAENTIECYGKIHIQDFQPRILSVSFGYNCDDLPQGHSLKGLRYDISIYDQFNRTTCMAIPEESDILDCYNPNEYMTFPTMVGITDWDELYDKRTVIRLLKSWAVSWSVERYGVCHQHASELICKTFIPMCDPETSTMVPLCKELCVEVFKSCADDVMDFLLTHKSIRALFNTDRKLPTGFNLNASVICEYLPSRLDKSTNCFYKPVLCQQPPNVTDTVIKDQPYNKTMYEVNAVVVYSCTDETFQLEGDPTISCQYSGQWSQPPECIKVLSPLLIVIPVVFLVPVIIAVAVVVAYFCLKRTPKSQQLFRNRPHDAFVCYQFDADNEFVINTIELELEEKCGFSLFDHNKHFVPGKQIMQNIQHAIENSNSAIIVMSQAFVDSIWCKEEFTDCYIEHMKDPAFRLFVIIMQPVDTLENTTEYMQKYFKSRTYLQHYDPKLFEKIATYLSWVKKPRMMEDKNKEIGNDEDPEILQRFVNV